MVNRERRTPSVARPPASPSTIRFARPWWRQAIALIAATALISCDAAPRVAGNATGNHSVRLGLTGAVIAAPGAVFEAIVAIATGSTNPVVLARDSVAIATGSVSTTLTLNADISGCLAAAAAAGGTNCTLRLTTRLKRDGALLDESEQTFTVNESTTSINAAPVELFEVNTVTVTPAIIPDLEPGDSLQLSAIALDRAGQTVTGRSLTFQLVSGGVTISTSGLLRALTPGPAVVRASMGGRITTLPFVVNQIGVATVTLAPLDTTVIAGGVFVYRATARSVTGAILTGRTINFSSSNAAVATINTTSGSVTASSAGVTTITATTPDGRGGATVSASTTLTVLTRPSIVLTPTSLSFDTEIGQPIPVAKTVTVTNGGAGSLGTLSIDSIGSGITAVLSSGSPPNTLTIRPTAAVAPGATLNTFVRIKSTTTGVTSGVVNVTIIGKQPPPVIVSLSTVAFTNVPMGSMSSTTNVSVTTSSGRVLTGLTTSIQYTPSAPTWLIANLQSTSTATTLSLRANAASLAIGTYIADVTISSLTDPHIPVTVRVTLQVVAAPQVLLSTKVVTIGPLNPYMSSWPETNVTVTSGLPSPLAGLSAQVQYSMPGQWLSAYLLGSTTPATLRITPAPSGLQSGTYQARVIVSTTTLGVRPDTVLVTMTVAAPVLWVRVATGDAHTCALSTSGVAYCWGLNTSGQLGNGTTASSNVPVKVSGSTVFSSISTSGNHTCAVTAAKAAYCWGSNSTGQVGVGSQVNVLVPTAVAGGMVFNEVKAGWRHSCGVNPSNLLYCWGDNSRGELGDGSVAQKTVPILVPYSSGARHVYLGVDYTCYSDSDGGLFCAGRNDYGQFGIGIGSDQRTMSPTSLYYSTYTAGGFHTCALYSGEGYCWGSNALGQQGNPSSQGPLPYPIDSVSTFLTLSAGYGHTCGISTDNRASCWGDNASGQLGAGSIGGTAPSPLEVATQIQFVEVSTGGAHTCARTSLGALYCWGKNVSGQLGNGLNVNTALPQSVTSTSGGMFGSTLNVKR